MRHLICVKKASCKQVEGQTTGGVPLWEREKQKRREFSIVDKRGSRRQAILTGGRQKEKTVEQRQFVAWQPVTLGADTLPTVLGTVNKCVCEMLWRVFCIKETKCQCVVQWQLAQLAKWHNIPASNKAQNTVLWVYSLFMFHVNRKSRMYFFYILCESTFSTQKWTTISHVCYSRAFSLTFHLFWQINHKINGCKSTSSLFKEMLASGGGAALACT